jgi:hypothetical protein
MLWSGAHDIFGVAHTIFVGVAHTIYGHKNIRTYTKHDIRTYTNTRTREENEEHYLKIKETSI